MSRKARRLSQQEIETLLNESNHTFFPEESLTLTEILPKNEAQRQAFFSWEHGENLVLTGSAGTGKSFIGLYLALKEVEAKKNKRVVVIRSAVQTRDIGHTPGTREEKEALYKTPYVEICSKLYRKKTAWAELEKTNKVEFMSTSFVRGITLDDTIIVLDEVQNCSFQELNSVVTRLGKGSRLIISGDTKQTDLNSRKETSGFNDLMKVSSRVKGFDIIKFHTSDIVRSDFVKSWIIACEDLGL